MSNEHYAVLVRKEALVFSAAHFITFNGDICERLHGHNYGVEVEIAGNLDENHYVVDFIAVRDTMLQIVQTLDHHMLLPTEHPEVLVAQSGDEFEVKFRDRRWVFPADDCVLLPIANTTAELIARHIGVELMAKLQLQRLATRVKIGVDENHGQWAFWTWHRP